MVTNFHWRLSHDRITHTYPETRIVQAARATGVGISTFLDRLLDEYIEDKVDIEQAERALQEPGEISAEELKAKYGL